MNDIRIVIRPPEELKAALEKLAEAEARSVNNYVVLVLQQHVKDKQKK